MNRKIILDAEVFTNIIKEINPTAAIYATIIGHRNGSTGECYITQANLAKECKTTDKTIERNLKKLREKGFLDWKKGSSFSSKANSYIFPCESFDSEGQGIKIEAKKLNNKNKEEKIKENVSKVKEEVTATINNENKAIKIGNKPTVAQFNKLNKERTAISKGSMVDEVSSENNDCSKITKNKIKRLENECIKLAKEYTDLGNEHRELFPDGFDGMKYNLKKVVAEHIEAGRIDTAFEIVNRNKEQTQDMINGIKAKIRFNELADKVTIEEAKKVYEMCKDELSSHNIFEKWIEKGFAKSIVKNIKRQLEEKGQEFDLEAMLVA